MTQSCSPPRSRPRSPTSSPIDEQVYSALYGAHQGTLKVAIRACSNRCATPTSRSCWLSTTCTRSPRPSRSRWSASLAAGLPGGSQLALASRTEPSIGVGRLRANRALTELTARDLAMTDAEADLLLRSCGLELQPESVELLVEHTEGWPAALYLATLSLRDAEDADQAAREFAGDDRIVADYLRDEFVARLSAEQLDFLTRTSILDELSGDLCDSVLGAGGSAEMLHDLARGNALVNAVDAKERTFRYHALLREMLGSELHRSYPREESALHARASKWFGSAAISTARCRTRSRPASSTSPRPDLVPDRRLRERRAGGDTGRWLRVFSDRRSTARPDSAWSGRPAVCRPGMAPRSPTGPARRSRARRQPATTESALRIAAGAIQAAGSARDGVARCETTRSEPSS